MNEITIINLSDNTEITIELDSFNITIQELIVFLINEGILHKLTDESYKLMINSSIAENSKTLNDYNVLNGVKLHIVSKPTGVSNIEIL